MASDGFSTRSSVRTSEISRLGLLERGGLGQNLDHFETGAAEIFMSHWPNSFEINQR